MQLENKLQSFAEQYLNSSDFEVSKLELDASFRKYYRINLQDKSYILMDSSLEMESFIPFLKISELLYKNGFKSPRIYASSSSDGLILLEDFGKIKLNQILNESNQDGYYKKLIDIIIEFQKISKNIIDDLSEFSFIEDFNSRISGELSIFFDWYPFLSSRPISRDENSAFMKEFSLALSKIDTEIESFIHADFHVDNLMITTDQKIGIIDYQDGFFGHNSYDLVSLLQDARREISEDFENEMINYYLSRTSADKDKFLQDYHLIGVQRNLRILGVFARKSKRDNNQNYIKFIPLVKEYIKRSLKHLSSDAIKSLVMEMI